MSEGKRIDIDSDITEFSSTPPMMRIVRTNWAMSPTVGKLVDALSKAQAKFDKVLKDSENPAYRSKYADLATVIEATRPHLAAEGLAIIQMPHARFGDEDAKELTLTTLMAHSSGEWISSDLTLPAMMRERFDAQSVGSAITYSRRYALAAMIGVAQEDDDGHKAVGGGSKEAANQVAGEKLRKAAAKKGDTAILFTEWKEGWIALSGGGLAIIKAEVEPEKLLTFGFKMDDNVVILPAAKALEFQSLCERAGVDCHWTQTAKGKVSGTATG